MVDAQSRRLPLLQETKNQLMRCLKDFGALHADGSQVVDVEEAPVVDLVGGHAPE